MALRLHPLHPLFAAETDDVDIGRVPDPDLVQEINAAMDRYAVLVLRGKPVGPEQQLAFTRAFGPLDIGLKKVRRGQPDRLGYEELADISNLDESGRIAARDHRRIVGNIANALWHSDSSFQKPAARYSMLHALVVTPKGGETEYADLRAAYDALPEEAKAEIDGLTAEHSALHSRIMLGETYTDAQKAAIPPAQWPLVRVHPGSGRKVLFVGVHITHVLGMTVPESRLLVSDLIEHATQRQFVYRHQWRPGDLVIWDNRCVIHRGRRHDPTLRRELRRSTTLDVDPPVGRAA
ncbi:MAG TPA: TauD/TfdA family dioxygenase [Alphaproteobacteria bacterium]|nr:TauD/TfdA family dioxygenase [Alphaproteobacteria bacterium]